VTGIDRIVDLSLPVGPGTQVYPDDPEPAFHQAFRIETDRFNVLRIELGTHTGTHVDAPYHFVEDGARIEELDPWLFAGPGVIVNMTGLDPRAEIGWDAIAPSADRLRPGTILALRTGWSDLHFGTDRAYDHPFLSGEACERILELGVRTLAIDAFSPDETTLDGPEPAWDVHRLVLGVGGVIAENLTNLGAVQVEEPFLCLFPLRLSDGADGSPCRAVALELATDA
jgi:kynurenine formamidase